MCIQYVLLSVGIFEIVRDTVKLKEESYSMMQGQLVNGGK